MANNKFKKAAINKDLEVIKKESNAKALIEVLKMINDTDLVDYPNNNEDLTHTEDLVISMKKLGFTDPIEVTDFNMENGKYMILSGHRRRTAWRKVSDAPLPCIVRHFDDVLKMREYILMSNAQRNEEQDPLLFCNRFVGMKQLLKDQDFKGDIYEEIGARYGRSKATVERYISVNNCIPEVLNVIRAGLIGVTNFYNMSKCEPEEQKEILDIILGAKEKGYSTTKEFCATVTNAYKNGMTSWDEMEDTINAKLTKGKSTKSTSHIMAPPIDGTVNQPNEEEEINQHSRNDEMNLDTTHREGLENNSDEDKYKDEKLTKEDKDVIERSKKQPMTDEEKKIAKANEIVSEMDKLSTILGDFYQCDSVESAKAMTMNMGSLCRTLISEMIEIADRYKITDELKETFESIADDTKELE